MKVLLDATALPAQRVGAGHYTVSLVASLAARSDVDVHVMAKRRDVRGLPDGVRVHVGGPSNRPARLAWEQAVLPLRARGISPDVFHGPHYTLPRGLPCPGVVTFHDPTFFTMPHLHERAKVVFFTRAARAGVKRARRVVAVSEYARRGAIEHAGADPDAVDVALQGVDHDLYRPDGDLERDHELRAQLGVAGPYLLWVGALEPRKDVPTLIRAYSGIDTDARLVLVGPPAWGAEQIGSAIARSGVGDRILRTGFVSDEEKIALYRGACALVYPSLAEGFGLPVLEAMACGCPVVTTSGSACEEVGADAVITVSPGDAEVLRSAIERVLGDDSTATMLRRAGPVRASAFTWEATAEATVASYRRAVG